MKLYNICFFMLSLLWAALSLEVASANVENISSDDNSVLDFYSPFFQVPEKIKPSEITPDSLSFEWQVANIHVPDQTYVYYDSGVYYSPKKDCISSGCAMYKRGEVRDLYYWSVNLENLNPGTVYYYQFYADGKMENGINETKTLASALENPDLVVLDAFWNSDKTKIIIRLKNQQANYSINKDFFVKIINQQDNRFAEIVIKPSDKSNNEYTVEINPTCNDCEYGYNFDSSETKLEIMADSKYDITENNESNNKKSTILSKIEPPIAISNQGMYLNLKGKIMIKVEDAGKAYYIHPKNRLMYYLGRPEDAFFVMRKQGVGIKNADLEKIAIGSLDLSGADSDLDGLSDIFEDAIGTNKMKADTDGDGFKDKDELRNGFSPVFRNQRLNINASFATTQKGMIFLQVENKGEAWYINPANGKRYFLGRPGDAFKVMKDLGIGITNQNFKSL